MQGVLSASHRQGGKVNSIQTEPIESKSVMMSAYQFKIRYAFMLSEI